MSYTREQRAANAAKAAQAAEQSAALAPESPAPEPSPEPQGRNEPDIPTTERPITRNEPRRLAMEELEARHERTSGTVEPPAEEDHPATPSPAPAAPAATPAPAPIADPQPVAPAVEMLTVKVDGVESQVPKSEVDDAGGIRSYQTAKAAEHRLQKANEALAETRRTQAQIAQWAQAQFQAQQQPPAPKVTDAQLLYAIRNGTEEEGLAALSMIETRSRGQAVDPNRLMTQTMIEINRNNAVLKFRDEFQDVFSNPIALRAAVSLDQERIADAARTGAINPTFDFPEFYRRIGNEVRSAFGTRPSQPAAAPAAAAQAAPTAGTPSQPSEKEARKASIVNLPTAAARAIVPEESEPGTPEEQRKATFEAMRKARGQPNG